MICRDFETTGKTPSNIVLRDKPFSITKNPKSNQYEQLIPSMVYKFFNRKTTLLADKYPSKQTKEQEIILKTNS